MKIAETANDTALSAKNVLSGSTASSAAASAQPPRERLHRRLHERVRLLDVRPLDQCRQERAVRRREVARRGLEHERGDDEPGERKLACESGDGNGHEHRRAHESAPIIMPPPVPAVRRRRPPCRPNTSAGTLSASRTATTPSGPPASNANHISAM